MCSLSVKSVSTSKSPVHHVDPLVRALNTMMYGVVVHSGTIWAIYQNSSLVENSSCLNDGKMWWATTLLAHEYWIYLQHANVFGNPLCQRLDRQYGIALLRSNQHWAIAGTLSAYWCRETISMFLCLPLLSRYTQYLVLYSLVYHTIKSNGVREDALRRYSPKFGIMRVVIDKFYHHTTSETIFSLVRLFLQGFDTLIHLFIIADMISHPLTGNGPFSLLHVVFAVWVAHASLNQYFRMSTASIMVHLWYALTAKSISHDSNACSNTASICETTDEDTDTESEHSAQSDELGTGFEVRNLLRALNILVLEHETKPDIQNVVSIREIIPYAWLLWSLLCVFSATVFRRKKAKFEKSGVARHRTCLYTVDVFVLVVGVAFGNVATAARVLSLVLGVLVTTKSYIRSTNTRLPKVFTSAVVLFEVSLKIVLSRWIARRGETYFSVVGASVSTCWGLTTLFSDWPNSSEEKVDSTESSKTADIVFLGHPAELSDAWALWLLPYSTGKRWATPWWAHLLWPIHYAVGYYTCNWRQKLFGDGASYFLGDSVVYEGIKTETWIACHFGRHFVTSRLSVKRNIEAAARHADRTGVKVLCLGALNKAEAINGGGVGVVRALGSRRKISIIHGNHLTAAAVVETVVQCFGAGARVFLTGASSKVGWAVAQALRKRFGFEVLCHSTDESRRNEFKKHGFEAASTLREGTFFSRLWIVGKYDRSVTNYIPQGATAVVFAVPHPLVNRNDVRVIEGGTLLIDQSRLNRPRQFCNKLKGNEIYACHAAGVVAAHRLKHKRQCSDETGPIDVEKMDSWLQDAKFLGFSVPTVLPVDCDPKSSHDLIRFRLLGIAPVVVIGAGPAGLAVAASLRRRGIMSIVLEEQTDPDAFGSWDKHFSGLEITTQKQWCCLPGMKLSEDDFSSEYITAEQYKQYLKDYARRFGIDVTRGYRAKEIVSATSDRWEVVCEGKDERFPASAVVVATGKNRIPRRDTAENLAASLREANIDVVHSADLNDVRTWTGAIDAARKGTLCVVGFGNSASDICSAILQSCRTPESMDNGVAIHVSVRTVPPVFPRAWGLLRIDTLGSLLRRTPDFLQEAAVRLLWSVLSDSKTCNSAFPKQLPRWTKTSGRVPVVDKAGAVASGFRSGKLIGHGPVVKTFDRTVSFSDGASFPINMAIMATGYIKECIITREDRLNGLYALGFSNDRFLPLKTIGEEAEQIANEIAQHHIFNVLQ